jgi:D-lactate dehydrogenase
MERASVQDFTLKGKIGIELHNATVGVIGTGRIGKTVINELYGFGCNIIAYDIYRSEEVKAKAEYVSLEELYKKSDIITLHTPATEDNYHMIDKSAIEQMKTGVMIINCARGSLIDTQALIDGIESGKIGFAGLDVIEQESGLYYFNRMGEPLGNPQLAILKSYSNVIVTPHTAFYTDEAVANMVENSILCASEFINRG